MSTPLDRDFVHRHLERLEGELGRLADAGDTRDWTALDPDTLRKVRDELAAARSADAPPGARAASDAGEYISANPFVSIAQSALHTQLARRSHLPADTDRGDAGPEIVTSYVWRFLHGKRSFCKEPAELAVDSDDVRLVLMSDWGTGREGAQHVSDAAREWISGTERSDRQVHLVHLGDNYYSGTPREAQENILGLWPADDSAISWSLLGNHDMYSGGHGFFEVVLEDPRFRRQRSPGGDATSWFRLRTPSWNILGLDTAWHDPLIEFTHGDFTGAGLVGHLQDPQADAVAEAAEDPQRKLLLLSHHQLFTAYDERADVGSRLQEKLARTLDGRPDRVRAWFWGHEHDCVGYKPHAGVTAARSIGHGAVPEVLPDRSGLVAVDDWPDIYTRGEGATPPDQSGALAWEYRGARPDDATNKTWRAHGFAVVDVGPETLDVRYIDDEGGLSYHETLGPDGGTPAG